MAHDTVDDPTDKCHRLDGSCAGGFHRRLIDRQKAPPLLLPGTKHGESWMLPCDLAVRLCRGVVEDILQCSTMAQSLPQGVDEQEPNDTKWKMRGVCKGLKANDTIIVDIGPRKG